MKEYLAAQLRTEDPVAGRHLVREVLQAKVLASLQRAGAMIPLAFHGGTALRFLYAISRFSEDLMAPLELSANALALALRVPGTRIGEIVRGRRRIMPETALRLGRYFGTNPDLWLGLQAEYDLRTAVRRHGVKVETEVQPRAALPSPPGPALTRRATRGRRATPR